MGRAFTLLLAPTGARTALGPAWAVLCGALVSGGWRWQADALLALLVALFVTEALWSTWRAMLIDLDWPRYIAEYPLPGRGDPVLAPPFTTPWSPVGRLLLGWGRVRRWMRETLPLERQSALFALPILPPLILVLSAAAGAQMAILSLLALALIAIEWRASLRADLRANMRNRPHSSLQASVEIGLSWLAGHLVFAPLTWQSLTLACSYALVYQGMLALLQPALSSPAYSWALALIYGGQGAAMALLVAAQRPLAALALGVLAAPQLLLVDRSRPARHGAWYVRHTAPLIMLAMLIAAWAI